MGLTKLFGFDLIRCISALMASFSRCNSFRFFRALSMWSSFLFSSRVKVMSEGYSLKYESITVIINNVEYM